MYIKTFAIFFVYKSKLQWLPLAKDNLHVYLYTKSKNNGKTFLYTESRTICKKQDNLCYVLYTKSETLHITGFFWIFWNWHVIYKNHDTLRYVTFYIQKIETLRKKKDNLCYVFICKKHDSLPYAIFHGFLKLVERGRHFYTQKNNSLCVTF